MDKNKCDKYKEYEELHIVAYALSQFINNAIQYVTAIEAYIELKKNISKSVPQNDFLELSYPALVENLFIEIDAIFDGVEYKGEKNCSLDALRELLESNKKYNNDNRDELVKEIDKIKKEYNKQVLTLKNSRNKLLAHHDLKEIFIHNRDTVDLKDIKDILSRAHQTISKVFEMVIGATFAEEDYNGKKEKYKISLLACIEK